LFPTNFNHRLWQIKSLLARFQMTRAMTVSQASASDLEQLLGIPTHQIDVVTEAADPVFRVINDCDVSGNARARYGIRNDSQLLVHVGGLNRHKNVLRLLQAMSAVVSKHSAVQLAIVGDTSDKGFWNNSSELKNFVQTHPPLDRHVYFTGYISDTELAELLNSAEALVFPSLWEGFGLPAVEAMSCGLPVLASRHGSLPEVVGDAGLFFDPLNPTAIADCILRFLSQPELQARLGENALKRARTFRWERAAELAEVCFRRCHADAVRRQRNA
jgi:glycosyltransferase involved in cell wall biosynthesis